MATKRSKRVATVATAKPTPTQTAQQIWLAGLGAASIARKRGEDVLARLVAEGKAVQTHGSQLARELGRDAAAQVKGALAPIQARVKSDLALAGSSVQHGVAVVLGKLGIPSKADIDELTTRVTALSRQLKAR